MKTVSKQELREKEGKRMEETTLIEVTTDYSIFKRLSGNRTIENGRKNKIRHSIRKVGQIPVPIVVNERMEVIDGQARLEVFEELGLPVYYIVCDGLGIADCIAMNISGTNWKIGDYIESYAEQGNSSYVNLQQLMKEYPKILLTNVACAATGLFSIPTDTIKSGLIEITSRDAAYAREVLDYVMKFMPTIKSQKMDNERALVNALIFAYQYDEVDNDYLLGKFEQNYMRIRGYGKVDDCLECLSEVYNIRRKSGRVYMRDAYRRAMEDKYSWYAKKWGKGSSRDVL